ncbi:MAG: hypothetical protein GY813_08800 [Halieaceae bacterium]|nr:hypothetical protein [Halieaceae bacterium]
MHNPSLYNIEIQIDANCELTADDPGTGPGQVNILRAVTVLVTVLDDSTGLPIEDASVYLVDTADYTTPVLSGRTDIDGKISAAMNYDATILAEGSARQMDLAGIDYEQKDISTLITAAGASVVVRLSRT